MTTLARYFPVAIYVVILFSITSFAQSPERRQTNPAPAAQEQTNLADPIANEISLLRKSVQSLSTRLREISEKMLLTDAKQPDPLIEKQNRISLGLELLCKAEQRAEILRRQLIELIEKETHLKTRLVQIDEEMRPESIERAMAPVGTTRTVEVRDVRRRVFENERRGMEFLLYQTSQSRVRLDEDVKQADALVSRLRQRIMPLLEKEIDKITSN